MCEWKWYGLEGNARDTERHIFRTVENIKTFTVFLSIDEFQTNLRPRSTYPRAIVNKREWNDPTLLVAMNQSQKHLFCYARENKASNLLVTLP